MNLSELSFVHIDEHTTRLWNINPTGEYSLDVETGRRIATEFIAYVTKYDAVHLLAGMIPEMARDWSGVRVGFCTALSEHLTNQQAIEIQQLRG